MGESSSDAPRLELPSWRRARSRALRGERTFLRLAYRFSFLRVSRSSEPQRAAQPQVVQLARIRSVAMMQLDMETGGCRWIIAHECRLRAGLKPVSADAKFA